VFNTAQLARTVFMLAWNHSHLSVSSRAYNPNESSFPRLTPPNGNHFLNFHVLYSTTASSLYYRHQCPDFTHIEDPQYSEPSLPCVRQARRRYHDRSHGSGCFVQRRGSGQAHRRVSPTSSLRFGVLPLLPPAMVILQQAHPRPPHPHLL
jgi:hypothetical protein